MTTRPHGATLSLSPLAMPRGFGFLSSLVGKPNTRLTKRFLERLVSGDFTGNVKFGHCTMNVYPRIEVPHPLPWLVLRHGTIEIGNEAIRLAAVVARRSQSALAQLPEWPDLCPALDRLQVAFPAVTPSIVEIQNLWHALILTLATPETVVNDTLTDLWSAAAKNAVVLKVCLYRKGAAPRRSLCHEFAATWRGAREVRAMSQLRRRGCSVVVA